MQGRITFATFDPVFRETPRQCTTCSSRPPIFHYEFSTGVEELEPEVGFCCQACAPAILGKLAGVERMAWCEEEAALKAENADISEFHRLREAAFHR